ncbi:hypothetical protein D3C78_1396660 [compost metagenome]
MISSVQKENIKPIKRIKGIAAMADIVNESNIYIGPNRSKLSIISLPRCLIVDPRNKIIPEPNIYPSGIQASIRPN